MKNKIIEALKAKYSGEMEYHRMNIDVYLKNPVGIGEHPEMSKTPKSIIGKLSREGVYRRSVYKTKTGESPTTKVELVAELAEALGISPGVLAGLEKAPKNVLKVLKGASTGE